MTPKPIELFISYRRTQALAVQAAVACLEQAGIRCFLDTSDIDPLADFPEVLRGAIANSKALLVWWSADYADSEHCMAELTLGWQYARAQSSDVSQRIWVVNPETTADHIYAGELQSNNLLAGNSLHDAMLTAQLTQKLATLTTPLSNEQQTVAAASYGSQAQAVSSHFTGRLRELWQLRSLLHPAQISQTNRLVAIQTHGMAGIGKTELARAYVDKFSAAYPGGVFWLNLAPLDSEAQVDDNSMRRVWADAVREALDWGGQSSFCRDSAGQYLEAQPLWEKLQQQGPWQSQPVLWLLDNVPVLNTNVYNQLQKWLTAPMANSHTLITTRFSGELAGFKPLNLAPLDNISALRLLRSYRDFTQAEHPFAEQLVQQTGAHTLALVLAGEHLKHSSYQQLIDGVNAQQVLPVIEQIAALLAADLGDKAVGIVATFALSLQRLNDNAKRLLALACQCEGNSAFPATALKDAAKALFQLDEMPASVALRGLSQAALVQQTELRVKSTDGAAHNEPMLELHPLTISACWHLLSNQQDVALPEVSELQQHLIVVVLNQFANVTDNRSHPQLQPYLALAHFLPQQHQSAEACSLRHRLELYYLQAGQLQNARTIAEENIRFFTDVLALPAEHKDVLVSKGNLASTLGQQGDLAGARRLAEAVLDARERTLGAEHPDTLTSKNNLAGTLAQQGDLAGARHLQEAVLEALERTLGSEHPSTLTSKNNLAGTLAQQGDLAGARRLEEAVLEARERTLGAEHPDTLSSKNNLANTLGQQGDLAGARHLQEAALEARERTLGAEHPNTLSSKNNLASTLKAQGDLAGARHLQEAVLDARERTLGAEHPDTLTSKNNLASTLWQQGDLAGARRLEEAVLETLERTLGSEHPSTLTSKSNLASTLKAQGDLAGARHLQETVLDALERTLGAEHPNTLSSKNNLAGTLKAQGDLAGARRLEEAVLEARERTLGAAHPATLTSKNNLAFTLWQLKELPQALQLLQQAHQGRLKLLGQQHPDVINTGEALLGLMRDMGMQQEAMALLAELRNASNAG
ncbi:tetratricopeptide repeat protein [Rheinheimera gaetbuli]